MFERAARIRRASELAEVAIDAYGLFGYQPYFRGHARASWQLVPSLYRRAPDPEIPQPAHLTERSLVNDFMRLAPTRYLNCPSRGDFPGWLCLMQHFGLPTRLLDWSMSVFVAAYFAVADEAERLHDAMIWAVSSAGLNELQMGDRSNLSMLGGPAVPLVKAPFQDVDAPKRTAFIIPPHIDGRMTAQLAGFTIHGTEVPLEEADDANQFLCCYRIKAEDKMELRSQLSLLGMSRMTLFPDLQNLAIDLANRRYGDRPSKLRPDGDE